MNHSDRVDASTGHGGHDRSGPGGVAPVVDASGRPGGIDPATGIDRVDLRRAMARLDPDDRALLAMRYVAGFSSTELAEFTGLSAPGTRARLARLLLRLREELDHG
jgi:DNA-directed RNA polymerase specialized sigma24 family protein